MKILICIGRLYMGGIEKYATDLAVGLKNRGYQIHILIFYKILNDEKKEFLLKEGIIIHEFNMKSGRDFRLPYTLGKLLMAVKPDVIHLNILPLFALLPLIFYRKKVIYTIHQVINNWLTAQLYRFVLRGVIGISKSVKELLKNGRGYFSKNDWAVINNGVQLQKSKIPDYVGGVINLVMVSRLAGDKQPDHAIEILNFLNLNSSLSYELTFVGAGDLSDDDYIEMLKVKVKNYRLNEKVHFVGWHEDVSAYLLKSHGFLMLSKSECFPYNVIEAITYGIPVFSYRIEGGLHDLHISGVTGVVCETSLPANLALEIDLVFNDVSVWKKFSDQAFCRSKIYTIEKMVAETEEYYRKLKLI